MPAQTAPWIGALQAEHNREDALITFLFTLSGVTLAGVGSAFRGMAAGALAMPTQDFQRQAG